MAEAWTYEKKNRVVRDENGLAVAFGMGPEDGPLIASAPRLQEQVRILREALKESLKANMAYYQMAMVIAEEKGYPQLSTEPSCIRIACSALEATKEGK